MAKGTKAGTKWTPAQHAKFRETMAAKAAERRAAGPGKGPTIKSSKIPANGGGPLDESHFMKFIRDPSTARYYLHIGPFANKEEITQFIIKLIGV